MAATPLLSSFLYCSMLSPDAEPTCVADIIRTSRRVNAELDVTGILVFDGQRFCQYLEGPGAHIDALAARIRNDPRHTDFRAQHHAPLQGARRFGQWSMAYALANDAEPLEHLHLLDGAPALQRLTDLLPELDLGPAVAAA